MTANWYKIVVLISLFCVSFNGVSQNKKKQDSLLNLIEQTNNINLKIDAYKSLHTLNRSKNPEQGLNYLLHALKLEKTTNNPNALADTYSKVGWSYLFEVERVDSAKLYLDNAYKISLEAKDTTNIATALTFLGLLNQRKGYYKTALDYYFESLKYKESLNDAGRLSYSYNLIAKTLSFQEQYEKSLEFYLQALKIKEDANGKGEMALLRQNIGEVYLKMGQYDEAIAYYDKALETRIRKGNLKAQSLCYIGLGYSYLAKEDTQRAIEYFENSKAISDSFNFSYQKGRTLVGLAKAYIKIDQLKRAENHAKSVFNLKHIQQHRRLIKETHNVLSEIYAAQNNSAKALYHYQQYSVLKDSIINKESLTRIAELEGIYNTQKKEQEIATLMQSQELEKQKQKLLSTIACAIAIISLSILFFIWYKNKSRKEKYRQQLEIIEQENEIAQLKLINEKNKNEHYSEKLKNFMQLTISKNEQIKKLKQELEHHSELVNLNSTEFQEKIDQLYNTTILTEEDWRTFRSIFEQVHPDFIRKIQQSNKSITPGEIKLAALLRLNLSNAEMSSVLGISLESVRKSKYRFRKKLALSTDKELQSFINTI